MNTIPPEVAATLKAINNAMKEVKAAVKDFNSLTFEQRQNLHALDQAELGVAALHACNSLAACSQRIRGVDPTDNEELAKEFVRERMHETRLREQRDRHLRPTVNQTAAKAFVRNAMFDVTAETDKDKEKSTEKQKDEPMQE
uniref:Nuclear nucleic acid-binding protein C1D n=1 Tax=Panagrellus redivivus TaxID=6233 RepID=A0A7E4W1T8_PANRE